MTDVFISYTSADQRLADFVFRHLKAESVAVFMASVSLQPGQDWTAEIRRHLRDSSRVLFLASRVACGSPYVQQELGGAFFSGKAVIPVIWEIAPEQLPGWIDRSQALDLRRLPDAAGLATALKGIAGQIHSEKLVGLGIVAGALFLLSRL